MFTLDASCSLGAAKFHRDKDTAPVGWPALAILGRPRPVGFHGGGGGVYGPGICPFADQNKTQTMMLTFLALGQAGFQPIVGQTASLPARTKSIEYSADIGFGQVQKW